MEAPAARAMPGAQRTSGPVKTGRTVATRSVATTGAAISAATSTPRQAPATASRVRNRTTIPAIAAAASTGFQPNARAVPRPTLSRSRAAVPSGTSNRSAAIQASSTPARIVPVRRATPPARRSPLSRRAMSAAPCAARTEAASGWVSGSDAATRAYATHRQPPPRSSEATSRSVASTTPRSPSAAGRASHDAVITAALPANATPATRPASRPTSIVPRTTINPAASAMEMAAGARMLRSSLPKTHASFRSSRWPACPGSSRTIRSSTVVNEPSAVAIDAASSVLSDRRPIPAMPTRSDASATPTGASRQANPVNDGDRSARTGAAAMLSFTLRGYTRPRLVGLAATFDPKCRCSKPHSMLVARPDGRDPEGRATRARVSGVPSTHVPLVAAVRAAWRLSLKNRSASSAAAQPEPAAVTA